MPRYTVLGDTVMNSGAAVESLEEDVKQEKENDPKTKKKPEEDKKED